MTFQILGNVIYNQAILINGCYLNNKFRLFSNLDEASGATDDYVVGQLKIPYAYTIELCDEGTYGFLLPPCYIYEVGRHFWTAVGKFVTQLQNDHK